MLQSVAVEYERLVRSRVSVSVGSWIKIFDQEWSKGGHFILTCKEEEIRLKLD